MDKHKYSIPVLMYHHVNPEGRSVNVTPERFEEHVSLLSRQGFTSLLTDDLVSIINNRQAPPEKPVMITFDDGWLDNWLFAFPILKKYNMNAVIFVMTSHIYESGIRKRSDEGNITALPAHKECLNVIEEGRGSEVMMSWDELREMEESGLVDIQSHTHTHQKWDSMYTDKEHLHKILEEELAVSKKIIEEKMNKRCSSLCWPWGRYNKEYIDLARSAGYDLLFTTEKGTNTPETLPWKIKRLVIGNISSSSLNKKLFIHSRHWLSKTYLRCFK